MPELPEVETIVRSLRPELVGRKIVSVRLLWARTLAMPLPEAFEEGLLGQSFVEIERRAKYLLFGLARATLIVHLRMSGDLSVKQGDSAPDKHDRLRLGLSGGGVLVFNDTRKFGRVWLVDDAQQVLGGLGPEPFDPSLTAQEFHAALHARRRQIKTLLLDQHFIAGLGNIYTDEALHFSQVHPLRLSDTISIAEAEKLLEGIRTVLQSGIEHNGASIDWAYRGGDFQNYFRAYGRAGQPCPVCGAAIQRIVVGQRGTHFCPVCQVM